MQKSAQSSNRFMKDDLWPLRLTDSLVLAGLVLFYLGLAVGMIGAEWAR